MESEFEFPLKLVRAKRKQRIGCVAFSHATRATHATPVKRNLGFVGAILGRCTTGNRIKSRCASFGRLVDGREVSWHLPHRWDAARVLRALSLSERGDYAHDGKTSSPLLIKARKKRGLVDPYEDRVWLLACQPGASSFEQAVEWGANDKSVACWRERYDL